MMREPAQFVLPDTLSFDGCEGLYSFLLQAQDTPVVLDGQHVVKMGGLAAQILATASLAWAAAGQSLTVANPSNALRITLETLALWPLPTTKGAV